MNGVIWVFQMAEWPVIEPVTSRSSVMFPNQYITTSTRQSFHSNFPGKSG